MTKASEISWKFLSIYLSHLWCSTNLHSSALGCITLDQDCTIAINQELSRIGLHCHIIHEGLQSWRTVSVTTSSQWSGSCVGCCLFFFFFPSTFSLICIWGTLLLCRGKFKSVSFYFAWSKDRLFTLLQAKVCGSIHWCESWCMPEGSRVRAGSLGSNNDVSG